MRHIQQKLAVARGEQRAELLFKNARVVNVFSGEIHQANVAVEDGRVIGFGDYKAKKVIDLKGAYLAPSVVLKSAIFVWRSKTDQPGHCLRLEGTMSVRSRNPDWRHSSMSSARM